MKRPRGAAVSGEIMVREEEHFEGNKRGEASQIQRTPLVGARLYHIARCRIATGLELRPRNRRLDSPATSGLFVRILQAFEPILNVSDEQKLPRNKGGARSWLHCRVYLLHFKYLMFPADLL